jgi:predicted DNA-binding transcriptional regulator YafY
VTIRRKLGFISAATFFRALRDAKIKTNDGIELKDKTYCLAESKISPDDEAFIPGNDELIALMTVHQIISGMTSDTVKTIFEPIQQMLAKAVKGIIKSPVKWAERIRILDTHYRKIEEGVILKIVKAIGKERVLKFHYTDSAGVKTSRTVSPQHLVRYKDNWYMDAWCHKNNGFRIFSIDTLDDLMHDNQTYITPDNAAAHNMYATSYGIFSGIPTQTARIRFTGNAARYAKREIWHPEQVLTILDNGAVELQIPCNKTTELLGAVMAWGEEAEVVGPESLREEIRGKIGKMNRIYEG